MTFAKHQLCLPNVFRRIGAMAEEHTEDWAHLSEVIRMRRRQLGLSQARITKLKGPSQPVQTQVETNDAAKSRPRADSLHKYDKPMQWEAGSTMAVLRGGQPRPISTHASIYDISNDDLIAEIRRRMEGRDGVESTPKSNASTQGGEIEKTDDDPESERLGSDPQRDDTALTIGEVSPSLNDAGVEVQSAETLSKRPAVRRGNG